MSNNFEELDPRAENPSELGVLEERLTHIKRELDLLLQSLNDLNNHPDTNVANQVRKITNGQINALEAEYAKIESRMLSLKSIKQESGELADKLRLIEVVISEIQHQIKIKSKEIENLKADSARLENLVIKPGGDLLILHPADKALLITLEIEMQNLQKILTEQKKLKEQFLKLLSSSSSESIH